MFAVPMIATAQQKTKPVAKPATAATKPATKSAKPIIKTKLDSLSYALGVNIAGNLKGIDLDTLSYNVFVEALKDVLKDRPKKMQEAEIASCLNAKLSDVQGKASKKEKQEGEAFLLQNKKRPGVVTTASGLQYEIITAGTGIKPTAEDTVVCHYKGTLLDGREFESSYKNGQPITYPANRLVPGWTEALQMMSVGSKWRLFIPSNLAYGDGGSGQIPPGATLIFEMELLDVKPVAKQ